MEINPQREDGTVFAKPEGRIDGFNASDFEKALRDGVEDDDSALVVDMANISYISSAGLRAILLTAKTLANRGMKFALCAPTGPIREVFEISGFDKIVAIHDTRSEALAAIGA